MYCYDHARPVDWKIMQQVENFIGTLKCLSVRKYRIRKHRPTLAVCFVSCSQTRTLKTRPAYNTSGRLVSRLRHAHCCRIRFVVLTDWRSRSNVFEAANVTTSCLAILRRYRRRTIKVIGLNASLCNFCFHRMIRVIYRKRKTPQKFTQCRLIVFRTHLEQSKAIRSTKLQVNRDVDFHYSLQLICMQSSAEVCFV